MAIDTECVAELCQPDATISLLNASAPRWEHLFERDKIRHSTSKYLIVVSSIAGSLLQSP
jgi:hypothetical protein